MKYYKAISHGLTTGAYSTRRVDSDKAQGETYCPELIRTGQSDWTVTAAPIQLLCIFSLTQITLLLPSQQQTGRRVVGMLQLHTA